MQKNAIDRKPTPAGEPTRTAQPPEGGFINETELLRRIPVSRRTLFQWRTSGKLPFVRVSGRRIIFHWPSVEAALLRQQKEAQ